MINVNDASTGHNDYYTQDGAPVKCWECGCEQIIEKVTDTLDVGAGRGVTMEFKCICGQCGKCVGYWAYGSYDPSFMAANARFAHSETQGK